MHLLLFALAGDTLALTHLSWRAVMARGPGYSPEEDAIILSTPNTREILDALRAAGHTDRSANAVKQRRNELRKKGQLLGPLTRTRPPQDSVTAAGAAYDTAKAHVARLEQELTDARAAAEQAKKQLIIKLSKE
ncbi:MAG: hypothetical protein ACXVGB_00180 [Mycobacteriaceae bacterium]